MVLLALELQVRTWHGLVLGCYLILGMRVVRVLEQSCVALWSVSQPIVTEETPGPGRTSCCAPVPSTPVETVHLLQAVLHLVS